MEPDFLQQCAVNGKMQQSQVSAREILTGYKKIFAQRVFKDWSKLCRMAAE